MKEILQLKHELKLFVFRQSFYYKNLPLHCQFAQTKHSLNQMDFNLSCANIFQVPVDSIRDLRLYQRAKPKCNFLKFGATDISLGDLNLLTIPSYVSALPIWISVIPSLNDCVQQNFLLLVWCVFF